MISAAHFGMEVCGTSSGEELVRCPFHTDSSPSAWFNPKKGLFWCAVCHVGKNLFQLRDALAPDLELDDLPEIEPPDYNFFDEGLRFELGEDNVYHDYLVKERKINPVVSALYGMRWLSTEPEAAVIPFVDQQKKTQGVMYRYVDAKKAGTRYRIIGEPTPVWPMPLVKHINPERDFCFVTEGAWSAMRIASVSDQLALSVLGAKANRKIADTLRPFQCVFLYDNDIAGRSACARMRQLMPTAAAWTLRKAPDDMTDEEIFKLMERIIKNV